MDTHGIELGPALERIYGGRVPADATLERLPGDASTRVYYRLSAATAPEGLPKKAIVMHLPADALSSDEGSTSARPRELPFLDVQRMLASRRLPVPRVLADDVPRRVVVLEDLGDETFLARLKRTPESGWLELYGRAVDLLVEMHARCAERTDSVAYTRTFDRALLRWELDHFREWGVDEPWGTMPAATRKELDARFDALADEIAALETGFVHRDYQSRNLMWAKRDVRAGDELVIIDFQDALIGPKPYDLVALLCDSYVRLDAPTQDALIARYVEKRGLSASDARAFERAFWLVAVQRKLKDSGRFVFIDRVRGNPSFLPSYAPSLVNVGRALARLDGLNGLDTLLASLVPGFPNAAQQPPIATGSARSRSL